jgi:hypothetical protein
MSYVDEVIELLKEHECMKGCDTDLLRFYTLLVLTTGADTNTKDVHDAWAAWRVATEPDHPFLVPFDQLIKDVQDLDWPYAYAIIRTHFKLKYDA